MRRLVVVSYNDEAWVPVEALEAMAAARGGAVRALAFDSKRYVGAQIGIHNPQGEKVGQVARLRNVEYLVFAGEPGSGRTSNRSSGMQIEGNVAVVTGAASGFGEATARRLHAQGAEIVVADMNDERGRAVADELGDRAEFVHCDVTSPEDVGAAIERASARGRFAISVHCAGGGIAARTLARDGTPHDLDAFRRVIELNLVGTFNVLRLAAAGMAGNEPDDLGERGVCVQTASIAGIEGQIGQIAYGSAKAGVIGMTIIAARDLAAAGDTRVHDRARHVRHAADAGRSRRDARRVRGAGAAPEAAGRARGVRGARPAHRRERLLER